MVNASSFFNDDVNYAHFVHHKSIIEYRKFENQFLAFSSLVSSIQIPEMSGRYSHPHCFQIGYS